MGGLRRRSALTVHSCLLAGAHACTANAPHVLHVLIVLLVLLVLQFKTGYRTIQVKSGKAYIR